MQRTYYEKLLADEQSPLAAALDKEVPRIKARGGRIAPDPDDADFADGLGSYLKQALEGFKQSLARETSQYQFELFQQTPAYQEAMVQMAANQYWTYETFFYFRALGEQTYRVTPESVKALLNSPLEGRGSDIKLPVPALMLVFDTPEMVDALYAGERRAAPGRGDYEAAVYAFVVEAPPSEGVKSRRLKLLSAHSGPHANHRLEVRRLLLQDDLSLEDILKTDWGKTAKSPSEARPKELNVAPKATGASRSEDYGYYGARVPYYRAILGALQRLSKPGTKLTTHPAPAAGGKDKSRLAYVEL